MRLCAVLLATAGLLCGGLGCSQAPKGIVGAWEMVETESPADSAAVGTPNPFVSVKILTDTHFAFGRMTALGEVWAGGGLYSYDGRGQYSEFITYHSVAALVGKTIDFSCRLDGDLWYHEAVYTLDGEQQEIHEVWRRIPARPGVLPSVPEGPWTPRHNAPTTKHAAILGASE